MAAASSRRQVPNPLIGLEVVLHPEDLVPGVGPLEGVRAEAVEIAIAGRNAAIAEQPGELMRGLGRMGEEIPRVVGLLHVGERIALLRMDEVGELLRIADEEDRRAVADKIVVAVLGIELERIAARIAHHVGRAALERHRREALEHLGLLAHAIEKLGPGPGAAILGELESAVGARTAGMDDALGNTLAVEARQLLDQVMILQQERALGSCALRALVVGDGRAVFVGQSGLTGHSSLLGWSALYQFRIILNKGPLHPILAAAKLPACPSRLPHRAPARVALRFSSPAWSICSGQPSVLPP